jgi:hypothetical protein
MSIIKCIQLTPGSLVAQATFGGFLYGYLYDVKPGFDTTALLMAFRSNGIHSYYQLPGAGDTNLQNITPVSVRFHHPDKPDRYSEELDHDQSHAIEALVTGTR